VSRPTGDHGGLRIIDAGLSPRDRLVARLHRFQGEHPEVMFTAPHMGGRGRYIAVVPAGSVPGDPREITKGSLDLADLRDQLEEIWPPEGGRPGWRPA
jgi:hypothetical protein